MYYLFLIITTKTNDKVGISIIFTENVNLYIASVTYLCFTSFTTIVTSWLSLLMVRSHAKVAPQSLIFPFNECGTLNNRLGFPV